MWSVTALECRTVYVQCCCGVGEAGRAVALGDAYSFETLYFVGSILPKRCERLNDGKATDQNII